MLHKELLEMTGYLDSGCQAKKNKNNNGKFVITVLSSWKN